MDVFVFLTGSGRCGSSLLQELLARHPDVGFVSNLDDRCGGRIHGRWNSPVYRCVPASLTTKGRLRFAPSEGYRALGRGVSPVVVNPGRPLTSEDVTPWLTRRFQDFFVERARVQRRTVFLHKFTGWPRVPLITAAFPDARIVHVVRDGRAVASSLVKMPWWHDQREASLPPTPHVSRLVPTGPIPYPLLAGAAWGASVDAHEAQRREHGRPALWTEIRYEDLLAQPVTTLSETFDGLGLHCSRAWLERISSHVHTDQTPTYERDLGTDMVTRLEDMLGPTLRRYGYL